MASKSDKNVPALVDEKTAALVAASLEADAGAGFENQTGEDIIMPVIHLLQALSPQVVEGMDGAKPGLLFNSVTEELMEEFVFVPALTTHEYVEFVPRKRGGGFVRAHELNSDVVKRCKATQPFGKFRVKDEEGLENELIEFFNVFGVEVDLAGNVLGFAVLRFKSTKIKVYKQYNTRMQTCQVPRADGNGRFTPAINSHLIRVSSVKESNQEGDFFNFRLAPAVGTKLIDSLIGAEDLRYRAAAEARALVLAGRASATYDEPTVDAADADTPF